jgi:hypothetical protein
MERYPTFQSYIEAGAALAATKPESDDYCETQPDDEPERSADVRVRGLRSPRMHALLQPASEDGTPSRDLPPYPAISRENFPRAHQPGPEDESWSWRTRTPKGRINGKCAKTSCLSSGVHPIPPSPATSRQLPRTCTVRPRQESTRSG